MSLGPYGLIVLCYVVVFRLLKAFGPLGIWGMRADLLVRTVISLLIAFFLLILSSSHATTRGISMRIHSFFFKPRTMSRQLSLCTSLTTNITTHCRTGLRTGFRTDLRTPLQLRSTSIVSMSSKSSEFGEAPREPASADISVESGSSPSGSSPSTLTRTIVVTSGKGGVGKTTATANIGMSIARLGYKVALIDSDIGLRNLDLLLGLENRILYTAMDVIDGQCRLDQALIRDKRWKNLSLLSISKNRQKYNVTQAHMVQLVSQIASAGYHFILIDCPAGIDVGFIHAISPASEAIIVTTPEITAIRDADRVAGLLEAKGIYQVKLLVNRVRAEMVQTNDMMSVRDVQEMLGIPLLGAIPEDSQVIISTNRGEPLVLKKKLSLSGIAFENASRRLIGKQDYFLDLAAPYKGIFQKVQDVFLGDKRG